MSACQLLSNRPAAGRDTVVTAALPDGGAFRGHLLARGIQSPGYERAGYTTKPNNGRGRMKGRTGVWESRVTPARFPDCNRISVCQAAEVREGLCIGH